MGGLRCWSSVVSSGSYKIFPKNLPLVISRTMSVWCEKKGYGKAFYDPATILKHLIHPPNQHISTEDEFEMRRWSVLGKAVAKVRLAES